MARKYHKEASTKQLTALKLINDGVKPTEAMVRAGYSKGTARNPKKNLMQSQAIETVVDKFKLQLSDEGITTAYMAKKYKEWLDAKETTGFKVAVGKNDNGRNQYEFLEVVKPDYHTQIEAGKLLEKVLSLVPEKNKTQQPSRRYTVEEFLNDD